MYDPVLVSTLIFSPDSKKRGTWTVKLMISTKQEVKIIRIPPHIAALLEDLDSIVELETKDKSTLAMMMKTIVMHMWKRIERVRNLAMEIVDHPYNLPAKDSVFDAVIW